MGEKRSRSDDSEQGLELKKLCEGLGIDEEGVESSEPLLSQESALDEAQEELVSDVMRSLEEELGVGFASLNSMSDLEESCGFAYSDIFDEDCVDNNGEISDPAPVLASLSAAVEEAENMPVKSNQVDLSYLLEASDDELGIQSSPSSDGEGSSSGFNLEDESKMYEVSSEVSQDFLDAENWQQPLDWSAINCIDLGFSEGSQDWLKRAVATLDMVMDSSLVPHISALPLEAGATL